MISRVEIRPSEPKKMTRIKGITHTKHLTDIWLGPLIALCQSAMTLMGLGIERGKGKMGRLNRQLDPTQPGVECCSTRVGILLDRSFDPTIRCANPTRVEQHRLPSVSDPTVYLAGPFSLFPFRFPNPSESSHSDTEQFKGPSQMSVQNACIDVISLMPRHFFGSDGRISDAADHRACRLSGVPADCFGDVFRARSSKCIPSALGGIVTEIRLTRRA